MHRPYDANRAARCDVGIWEEPMTSDRPRGNRRSVRLPGYDYAQPGAYFVTICTHGGECLFDDPVFRRVVETVWQGLPRHFPRLSLDAWVVMPNHFHGIPILRESIADVKGSPGNASPLQREPTLSHGWHGWRGWHGWGRPFLSDPKDLHHPPWRSAQRPGRRTAPAARAGAASRPAVPRWRRPPLDSWPRRPSSSTPAPARSGRPAR
jgi:REP element-mobilizing transposase RayT